MVNGLLNFNRVLQDIRYKPNTSMVAYESEGQWWLRVVMLVEDARGHFEPWRTHPYPQDREDLYFFHDDLMRAPKPEKGVGWSPSRELIELRAVYAIPMFSPGDETTFLRWIRGMIHSMEKHESDEWFRYKGELVNDPHKGD